ncbi:hypothetical protein PH5382_02920 [Phaeobacter sp. CECT 5382]|uniref:glycosyltransferase n=1 Tax=Phaeobacter sp. CECT 5382 TaxID=1712645 RepID=UPI0006DA03FC|nr:glycosyltransferase [Phaeobacter sp. CECT 5382]CUH88976.1 hypothetical protein PH5382_02920 [Phaeobacter sp. CECT 5382]
MRKPEATRTWGADLQAQILAQRDRDRSVLSEDAEPANRKTAQLLVVGVCSFLIVLPLAYGWQFFLQDSLMQSGLMQSSVFQLSLGLAALGAWRLFWSGLTYRRARRYSSSDWPALRRRADRIWTKGWRPERLHIQITACFETPELGRQVIFELVRQIRNEAIPTTVYYGTTSAYDEAILNELFEEAARERELGEDELGLELVFIRLQTAGHFVSMGKVLREIRRWGAGPDDLIIFLDDDTILGPDVLKKTLPLFALDMELQLVTTDQKAICFGASWICTWLRLRFEQRRQELSSQALSGRILPFSGRIRILRARDILDESFICAQEVHQQGLEQASRFRRLSVADSITWCHLLKNKGKMLFVPDVHVYSISLLKGVGWHRIALHLRRWSGQMMQRSGQVIAMGPVNIPTFVWLRVVDLRLSALLAIFVPLVLLSGEMMRPGFAAFWISLVFLVRVLLGVLVLEYQRNPWILLPYTLCVTSVVHGGVTLFEWASRVRHFLSPDGPDGAVGFGYMDPDSAPLDWSGLRKAEFGGAEFNGGAQDDRQPDNRGLDNRGQYDSGPV